MRKIWMKNVFVFALVMCAGIAFADVVTSFGVNFTTADGENISTTTGFGFSKDRYAAPVNWTNVPGSSSGNTTITLDDGTEYPLEWSAKGTWNSGVGTDSNIGKLLYGYLDDAISGGRIKATVTISGLPEKHQYAIALILSGDGNDAGGANNLYSPVLINGQTYSYAVLNSVTNLVIGDAAASATTWGNRGKSASQAGELLEGVNVMFVEGLSGTNLTITSAMENWNTSRLTIAGVQVWIMDMSVNLNFYSEQGSVSGYAGLDSAGAWNNLTGASGASLVSMWNGCSSVDSDVIVRYGSSNGYQYKDGVTDEFLKGYLDDGGSRANVSVENIPFSEYSVIVYTATDTQNAKFKPVKINGKWYTYSTEEDCAVEIPESEKDSNTWGLSRSSVAEYGTNALRVDGLAGNLTIEGGSNSNGARGGIAALQILNNGDLILPSEATIEGEVSASTIEWSDEPSETNPAIITSSAPATVILDEPIAVASLKILGESVTFSGTEGLFSGSTLVEADTDVVNVDASLGSVIAAEGKTLTIGNNAAEVLTSFTGEGTLKFVGGTVETPLESELYGIKTAIGGTKESPSYLKVKGAALSANRVHKVIGNGPDASYFICGKDGAFGFAAGTEIKNVTMVHANSGREFWWERGDFSGSILRADAGVTMNQAFSPEFAGLEGSGAITAYYASSDARTFTLNTSSDNRITSYGGVLSGNKHSVKVKGSGVQVFTGVNTYAAGTTVESGTLRLTGDGEVGSGAVTVAEGATFELRDGVVITNDIALAGNLKVTSGRGIIYGNISGEGTITVDGEGSVLGIGMVGYDDFTGTVVLTNKGAIVLPAGFETNHNITVGEGCMLALRLNHQQIFKGYTANPPEGVTVKFYSETGSEVPAESVEGNTYRPTINTWEKGAWMRDLVANENVLIYVSEDYTAPVQLPDDITLGTVKIEGVGSVSFSGGVLTASEIEVSTILSASEDASITLTANPETLALGPMTIGERATVDYTFTSEATIPQLSGAGTFVKRGTEDANLAPANEYGPTLVVAQGKMIFNEAYIAYDKTYNIVVNGGATLQVGDWLAKITSTASVYTLKAGATLFLNNGNTSANIAGEVAASIVIDSTEDNPATITGSEYGIGSFISGGISGNGVLKLAQSSHKYRITGVIADGANDGDVLKVKVDSAEPDKLVLAAENTFSGGMEIAEGAMLTIANPKALGAGVATINGMLVLDNADIAIGSKVSGSGTITNTVAGGSVKFTEGGAIVPSYDGCLSVGSTLDESVVFDVSSLVEKSDKRFDLIRASSAETLPMKQFIESELKSYKRRILGDWKVVPVRNGIGWALQSKKFCVFVH